MTTARPTNWSVEWVSPMSRRDAPVASWARRIIAPNDTIVRMISRKAIGLSHRARGTSPNPTDEWRPSRWRPSMKTSSTWTPPRTPARGTLNAGSSQARFLSFFDLVRDG